MNLVLDFLCKSNVTCLSCLVLLRKEQKRVVCKNVITVYAVVRCTELSNPFIDIKCMKFHTLVPLCSGYSVFVLTVFLCVDHLHC